MRDDLIGVLAEPGSGRAFRLEGECVDGWVESGSLTTANGSRYPIDAGVPRLVRDVSSGQAVTRDAFAFKWAKPESYASPAMADVATMWYAEKYGFESPRAWMEYFDGRASVLEIGCGAGAFSWLTVSGYTGAARYVGVDISSAIDAAQVRFRGVPNTSFVQADALDLPFQPGSFSTVYSEGVLHHTPSTAAAIRSAAAMLETGGEAHFYVYRRKAPLREYADDYVRDLLAPMDDESAWGAMRELTLLGKALSDLHATITVPVDVTVLGIAAGTYDVQRLLYYNVAKLYWNDRLSLEENVHVNFDWYRPLFAHRQTEEQVRAWCGEAGLRIDRLHEQESGYTVRATRLANGPD